MLIEIRSVWLPGKRGGRETGELITKGHQGTSWGDGNVIFLSGVCMHFPKLNQLYIICKVYLKFLRGAGRKSTTVFTSLF